MGLGAVARCNKHTDVSPRLLKDDANLITLLRQHHCRHHFSEEAARVVGSLSVRFNHFVIPDRITRFVCGRLVLHPSHGEKQLWEHSGRNTSARQAQQIKGSWVQGPKLRAPPSLQKCRTMSSMPAWPSDSSATCSSSLLLSTMTDARVLCERSDMLSPIAQDRSDSARPAYPATAWPAPGSRGREPGSREPKSREPYALHIEISKPPGPTCGTCRHRVVHQPRSAPPLHACRR